jgi:hypothetical protein
MSNYDMASGVDVWRDEDNWVPVILEDLTGGNATGIGHADITARYARESDTSQQTLAPDANNWKEKGLGEYMLKLPSTALTAEGCFFYTVWETDDTGKVFKGSGHVRARRYEVFVNVAYDETTTTLHMMLWLHKDGQLVSSALLTSAQCIVYLGGSEVAAADVTFTGADLYNNEVFYKTTTVALTADKVYQIKGRITFGGVLYYGGEGGVTFN